MSTRGGGGGGGGVGQDHVCAIIVDSLMSTSNEMCVAFSYTRYPLHMRV